MKMTWKHAAGTIAGATVGVGAGVTIAGFMATQALTAPLSFPIGGGITGFIKSSKKGMGSRIKNGAKYSALCLAGAPISAPIHLFGAPVVAIGITTVGAIAGFLLVERHRNFTRAAKILSDHSEKLKKQTERLEKL